MNALPRRSVVRLLLACGVAARASQLPGVEARARVSPPEAAMMQVQPESPSLIVRATHILAVRLLSADEGAWHPRAAVGEARTVTLRLELEAVLKGAVAGRPGERIEVTAQQARVGESWAPMPGIWSGVPLEVGIRWVVFAVSGGSEVAPLLTDPAGIRVYPADMALPDVETAARIEDARLDLKGAVALVRPVAGGIGPLFADFFWARYGYPAMMNSQDFDQAASLLEEPRLALTARNALLMAMSNSLNRAEPVAAWRVSRLAVALFRVLAEPEARPLRDNIIGVYLPNLLEMNTPHPYDPKDVFRSYPQDHTRAIALLSGYHPSGAAITRLLKWLQ